MLIQHCLLSEEAPFQAMRMAKLYIRCVILADSWVVPLKRMQMYHSSTMYIMLGKLVGRMLELYAGGPVRLRAYPLL